MEIRLRRPAFMCVDDELGDAGAADAGGAHLRQHLVEPLQGPVEVQLDPAGGAGHRLAPGTRTEQVGERSPHGR